MLTAGEPAGIGPDIILKVAEKKFPAELVVVGDPDLLLTRAHQKIELRTVDLDLPPALHEPGVLSILPVALKATSIPGQLNLANAHFVIQTLEKAIDACMQKKAAALVTGPVNKFVINEAGIPFSGHTEFLCEKTKADDVLMLFVVDQLKIALQTVHLPLIKVPSAINVENILKKVRLLQRELKKLFQIPHPKIFVTGLNPHAGESGLLGREEIDIIQPAIEILRAENISIEGPFPADTIFTPKHLKNCDAILAMYHDQALPVVKYLGFDRAVNMTLGLPIIRTSVDHGTALDIAGTGTANAGSMQHAIELAIQLSHSGTSP
jgi:4-hydroxythreonine-4-phosphate dehydrogenase